MEPEYIVQNFARICWVLTSLGDEHQVIDIDFPQLDTSALSMIVEVDSKKGFYYIDKIHSESLHNKVINGELFNITTSLRGVDIIIKRAVVDKVISDSSGIMYRVKIPSSIVYIQKRDLFRAKVRGISPVDVTVMTPKEGIDKAEIQAKFEDEYVPDPESDSDSEDEIPSVPLDLLYDFVDVTRLIDISAGGCKVSLDKGEIDSNLPVGALYSLAIAVPELDEALVVEASVKYCLFIKRTKIWQVGFEFKDLSHDDDHDIKLFVNHLQVIERQKDV